MFLRLGKESLTKALQEEWSILESYKSMTREIFPPICGLC